jgi:transposase
MTTDETITISKQEYRELLDFKAEVGLLKHQLAELKRMMFGQKRERFVSPDPAQGILFDLPVEETTERQVEEITYTRTKPKKEKKQPLRVEIPSYVPRREETIKPDNIPADAKKIGERITEILEYEPPTIYVRKIICPKYIVETSDEGTKIEVAPLPSLPIPKGNAGASIIAHILVSKFTDHLPYYRQSKIFKRQGLYIPDSTIGGWANTAISNWLTPLWEAMKAKMVETDYLMADETPIPVLTKDKPGSTHRGYHWVYYDPIRKIVIFDYQQSRSRSGPKSFLKNFSGYLQTDGYSAYEKLAPPGKITLMACMAHARRTYEKSLDNDPRLAQEALTMIQDLYKVEREARETELSYDEIKSLRQEKSVKILDQFEKFLFENKPKVLPKSAIGKAFNYTLNLWPRLKRYVDDGRFNIDNNLIENSIRPVALGRKNYLFAGSHEGAKNAAVIYSLLATCKLNNIEPFEWLKEALETIPDYPANQLHKLIPGQK